MLRQKKDWVGGLRKWQVLLTFNTVSMLWVGESEKSKIMLTLYMDGPLLLMGYASK